MTTELIALRENISEIDREILQLLEERMRVVKDIAEYKLENDLPIEDKEREKQVVHGRKNHTSLNEEFVEDLFELIIKESKRIQDDN